ncbi:Fe(3+) ABC transporter substrate-binding protein [Paenibacillus sambharensis]|uniref:Fe(3+) ABC transporter substrate-binding protein n=1 Tax=Paenibacillus sambharensis TaxID=1803190 RepID=A0A2W1LDL2_9BACL|nr:ABC transporter substrate-binding protein [Paenibacillus sambharensis]PZD96893.1 Fe(3+) ABC transporter substrate-binding protein [Paenibacillus sambharensis]
MKFKTLLAGLMVIVALSGCGGNQTGTTNTAENAGGDTSTTGAAASNNGQAGETEASGVSGKLAFYTSQPEEDVTKLVDAFNSRYPDVEVETFRSGTEEVIAKVMAEKQAGKVQADVLLVADAVTFEGLKKADMLLKYESPERASIPEEMADPDGMYTGTKVMATALVYNTAAVQEAPVSWSVLTAPENKDQAIMPSPVYSGAAAYNVGVLSRSEDFGWSFFEQLKENGMTVIKGNGAVIKAVAAGEKSYGMVVDFLAVREKQKGSPVELVYPEEGVPVITEPIGIMKETKNEAAAQAFVDFVLSEEGQKLAAETGYTPVREGIAAPEGLKTVSEMKVLSGDIAVLTEAREEDKKAFISLFGE